MSQDLRGHADSECGLNGDYSISTYALDCLAVVEGLGRPPVLIVALPFWAVTHAGRRRQPSAR